jgi:hypothetical protein
MIDTSPYQQNKGLHHKFLHLCYNPGFVMMMNMIHRKFDKHGLTSHFRIIETSKLNVL